MKERLKYKDKNELELNWTEIWPDLIGFGPKCDHDWIKVQRENKTTKKKEKLKSKEKREIKVLRKKEIKVQREKGNKSPKKKRE